MNFLKCHIHHILWFPLLPKTLSFCYLLNKKQRPKITHITKETVEKA